LVIFIAVILPKPARKASVPDAAADAATTISKVGDSTTHQSNSSHRYRPSSSGFGPSAEQIVANKVIHFARKRHQLIRLIARRSKTEIPPEVEKFFEALERGNWDEIKPLWDDLARQSGQYEHSTHRKELDPFWPTILDAYGVAEQAHDWPAQQLLDYGNAILSSLRPGMVYVGGTDDGRWIPELLNETGDREEHIIVTQNALADGRYLDFVNTLYADRMTTLTGEDLQAAFQNYGIDAQKRLEHDQQFPEEAKQLQPGENIQVVDGKVQVSGQTAVMAINERLLQALAQKNPDLSFGIQESFPFRDMYGDALPMGPLMELGAGGQNNFGPDQATQSLQYWQATAQQVLADPDAANSQPTLKSYSHDAVSAANLLAAHNFTSEAEQAYGLATQLWPENPESVGGLADLLAATGRQDQARQLLQNFAQQYPAQQNNLGYVSVVWRSIASQQTPH
jgi:hypothetical protein